MISKEKFEELELEHGCGYWNVCWEHACPCAITVENKGLREDIYNSLAQEAKEVAEQECESVNFDYELDFYEPGPDDDEEDDYEYSSMEMEQPDFCR